MPVEVRSRVLGVHEKKLDNFRKEIKKKKTLIVTKRLLIRRDAIYINRLLKGTKRKKVGNH